MLLLTFLQNKIEDMFLSEEPLSFYQKRQLDFEKQCRLLNIDIHSPEADELRKSTSQSNNNFGTAAYTNSFNYDEVTLFAHYTMACLLEYCTYE